MAEGDKSLGEKHREARDKLEARGKAFYGDENYVPPFSRELANNMLGTCPWRGGGQAQIVILQDDPRGKSEFARAGRVIYSEDHGAWVGDAKARVCLICGRVELADSKPGSSTSQT